jgi:tetratricopeptide (TPR) repeat protein
MKKSLLSNCLKYIIGCICIGLVLVPLTGCGGRRTSQKYPGHLSPGSPEYLVNEAIFLINSGDLNTAEKKLLKALKKKPTMIAGLNALGIVYLNKREFKKAADYFTKVVRIDQRFYDAYNYLGVVYTELDEYNIAKENLLIAANADTYQTPENAFANLAMLEIRENKYDSALRYVDKGIRKNTKFAPLSNLKGVILEHQGKLKDSIMWYKRALSFLTEPDATYLINIARVYKKMGEKEKALDTLEKALSKAFTPQLKVEIRKLINNIDKADIPEDKVKKKKKEKVAKKE